MSDLWMSIAIGVAVPVVLLLGPNLLLLYLLPRRSDFQTLSAEDCKRYGRDIAEGIRRGVEAHRG